MKTWLVKFKGLNGPCVWDNLKDALTEIEEMSEEMVPGESVVLTLFEMPKKEFDALPEFEGY